MTDAADSAGAVFRRSDDAIGRRDGQPTHLLQPLPYAADALEPVIDAHTMMLHHDQHHAAYVEKLNAVLGPYPLLCGRPATWLILNGPRLPAEIRTAVRNSAGGHVNHGLLWRAMSPSGDGEPANLLVEAIRRDFGSLDDFKAQFEQAGEKLFGSGWVWLVRTRQDRTRLAVMTTSGQDNPLTDGHFPILVNDVWEHAYYLKHQNRRLEYLRGWWPVVNWEEAALRFGHSDPVVDRRNADGDERVLEFNRFRSAK